MSFNTNYQITYIVFIKLNRVPIISIGTHGDLRSATELTSVIRTVSAPYAKRIGIPHNEVCKSCGSEEEAIFHFMRPFLKTITEIAIILVARIILDSSWFPLENV